MSATPLRFNCAALILALSASSIFGQTNSANSTNLAPPILKAASTNYILTASDIVHIRIFREEDLETRARLAKDGTITFPLLGTVQIGGKTIDQATGIIRDLLAKDYLVNPQVSITIVEFAKRRFTIMGEVSRPGTYDMPDDQSLTLLQAISMAGGYTRLANAAKITVQRQEGAKKLIFNLDAKSMAKDKTTRTFEILPDDNITVGESIF